MPSDMKQLSTWIPEALEKQIRKQAKKEEVSVSHLLKRAARLYLEQNGAGASK